MPHKSITLGIVGTLLLATCGAGLMLISLTGWWFFTPARQSRPLQIALAAPLKTPIATVPQAAAVSPPGLRPAAMTQYLAAGTPTPTQPAISPAAPQTPTPTPGTVQPGVATRLVITKLNLDAQVVFSSIENGTWNVEQLGQAIGHLEATAPPGSASNMVLAGHVTLNTGEYGPFASLHQLIPGDMVIVYEGEKKFFYVIENTQTVEPDRVEVTYPTSTGKLTLLTCINWNSAEGRYSNRLVVRGRLINS